MASAPFVASTNDISSDDETEDEYSWISYFCSLKGNELFCEIDPDFVSDSFNLTGLAAEVPYYEFALDVILDVEVNDDQISEEQQELIETEAETLYGLIHARFILCKKGLHAMYEKYRLGEFGHCPRVYCKNQSMLPVGIYDRPGKDSVKTFCPRCQDVYQPKFPRSDSRPFNLLPDLLTFS